MNLPLFHWVGIRSGFARYSDVPILDLLLRLKVLLFSFDDLFFTENMLVIGFSYAKNGWLLFFIV